MSWKNWQSYLKGGVIGTGMFIIIALISFLIQPTGSNWHFPFWFYFALFPGGLISYLLPNFTSLGGGIWFLLIGIFLDIIFYFLIGALIGWIIGKIKSRK